MTNPFSDGALLIDVALVTGLTIHVRTSIHWIAEHIIDGDVGRVRDLEVRSGGFSFFVLYF